MWSIFRWPCAAFAAAILSFAFAASARADAVTYQRVVGKGDAAPGTPAGVTFGNVLAPAISPTGQVSFLAGLAGTGVNDSNSFGYWAGAPGSLQLAMRKGAPAPGTDTTYGPVGPATSSPPPIDSGGNVMFSSPLNSKVGAGGLWAGPPGAVTLLGQSGGAVPDMPGYQFLYNLSSLDPFGAVAPFTLNAGRAAFAFGVFNDPDAPRVAGLWVGPPGVLHLAARTDAPAPGIDGATLRSFVSGPVLNSAGTVAFRGDITGAGVGGANSDVIFLGQPGALRPAVRTGMAAPGTAGKTIAGLNIEAPGLNSKGEIAFGGQLRDAQGTLDNGSIWVGTPDALRLVAESGSPAPGAGGTFASFGARPSLNNLGQVAFKGTALTGGGFVSGVWAGTPDALGRVALVGDPAPVGGTAPAHFTFVDSPWLNNAGQVAFLAVVDADDRSFEGEQSLWVRDALGALHLAAREGGTLDVNGVARTIATLNVLGSFGGSDTGLPSPFNDAGQLAFQASFANGDSGIFIATVPVPEPTAIAVLGGAGFVLLHRRRRPRFSRVAPLFMAAWVLLPAVARADTFYVSSANNNTVSKVAEDGTVSVFASGLKYPEGLALDPAGNLYVANRAGGTISKISPAGVVSTFAAVTNVTGLAFDSGGNLYAAQFNQNDIVKISPSGTVTPFASGLNGPFGLAFDAAGNLYAANFLGGTVSKVTPAGAVGLFATVPAPDPFGLAFDHAGNLLVSDVNDSIYSVSPTGVVDKFATLASGSGPSGLTVAGDGNVYVTTTVAASFSHEPAIYRITPAGVVSTYKDNFADEFSFSQFIVARPVPEPSAACIVAAWAALGLRRRRPSLTRRP
jgi:sugar lactone lactonase YvrE